MNRICYKILMCLVAVFVTGINAANADLQCVAQPSCQLLGYSTENVTDCVSYIHCPFDKSYKKCVAIDDVSGKCSGYTLASCPPHAKCEPCGTYKITTCKTGYTQKGNTCVCATTCQDRISQKDIPLNAGPIKQSCNACGAVSDIITGWQCSTGYVEVSGECKKAYSGCEAAGYLSDKLANATCDEKIVYTSDGSALRCYTDCACDDGYVKKDGECVEFIDCSDYTLKTCPDNAICSACTDNDGNTSHKFEKCDDGYKEQSGICVCEKVCSDTFTGTIPANGFAVKESCTACGVTTDIVTDFACDGGYVKKDGNCIPEVDCSSYPLSSCPDNATCAKCTDADGNTSYRFDKCNTGYTKSGDICVCEKVCEDLFTGTVPENATLKTETCTACGVSTTIKTGYTCNNGYSDSNGSCVCSTVCKDTYTKPIPAHGKAKTEQCTACGVTTDIVTDFACDNEYAKKGDSCVCEKVCEDTFTGRIPENATAKTETCTACGETSQIVTDFTCNTGYTKSGDSCVCSKVCEDTFTGTIPEHGVAITQPCEACGVTTEIVTNWTCEGNYTKEDDKCVCSKVCADTFTDPIPEHGIATTEPCVACGVTTNIVTGFTCEGSYTKQNGECVCSKVCSDTYTGSLPAHAKWTTSTCTACGVDTEIKTGWKCEDDYTENSSKTGCQCKKTCEDLISSKPANSTYVETDCTACGTTTKIKTDWRCDTGYMKKGEICEKIIDCSSHTLTSCPIHAVCSDCTDNDGDTTYRFENCDTDYTLSGGVCVCGITCNDKISSKPANSYYTYTECDACGDKSDIKTGWECNDEYKKNSAETACVCRTTCEDTFTGSLPSNAHYNYDTNCTACGVKSTIKIGWDCDNGYEKNTSETGCVCSTTCKDTFTGSLPANAHYEYDENCTACGVKSTIITGWDCNTDYEKNSSKTGCVCSTTCKDTFTGSLPDHAHYTYSSCYACGIYSSIIDGWECDNGYHASGNKCVCDDTCSDTYTGSLPDHAHYTYSTCTACGESSSIIDGWACDNGYHKSGNTCVCDDTCNDTYTGTKPTHADYVEKDCYACGIKYSIITDYECHDGYTGSDCHCATTCIDKVTTKPTHSGWVYEDCSACGVSSTIKGSYKCYDGYTGSDCHCATTCTDKVTSKPAHSTYIETECKACDETTTIKTGWKCEDEYKEQSGTCVCKTTCTDQITTKPTHSSWDTETCTACGVSTTIKTGFTCHNGYTGSDCHCATTCTDLVTSKPDHSHWDETDCTACGTTTKIKTGWKCDSGYVKVGSICEPAYASCEDAGYLSSPEDHAICDTVGIYLTNGNPETCYKNCVCESGYDGPPCKCIKKCTDKVTTKPHNAHYVYENCTACGETTQIKSDWECDAGLIKSGGDCLCPSGSYETNSECETANANSNCTKDGACYTPTSCKTGYSKTLSGCGNTAGFTLGATDAYGCAECQKKECGSVWVYKPDYSSGSESSATEYVESTTDSSVEVCGNAGSTGWTRVKTGRYSGTQACYACQRNNCPSGYITGRSSVADCGPGSWDFDIASTKSGEQICSKCTYNKPTCPSGYDANITSASQCGSSGANGWTVQKSGSCGKCVAKDCTSGLLENVSANPSGTLVENVNLRAYEVYFNFTSNGYYSGDMRCGTFTLNKPMWCADYKATLLSVCKSDAGGGYGYWFGYGYDDSDASDIFTYCGENPNDTHCALASGDDLTKCIAVVDTRFSTGNTNYDFCSKCGSPVGSIADPNNWYYCQNWGDY